MNIRLSKQQKSKPIYQADDIYAILQQVLLREGRVQRRQEYFWILGLNSDRTLVFLELLALGAQNRVEINPPEAYRMAIYKMADYVIFAHNHPSGRLQPSAEDRNTTDKLVKTGELINITVLDHFIISEKSFYSFAAEGLMKEIRQSSTYTILDADELKLVQMQYHAAGVDSGRVKGLEMGIELGKEKGKEEGKEEIAAKALEQGFTVAQVVKLTGLSKAAVMKLGRPAAKGGGKKK
jgi:DNA repair protein RadC